MQSLRPRIAALDQRSATASRIERIRGRKGVAIRRRNLDRDPLCAHCHERGLIRLATEVDHVIPLEYGGADTDANKQNLCHACHAIKTASETRRQPLSHEAQERRFPSNLSRARIPLTMVCGPPGSGKSTYLREHMGANDVLIDVDRIMQTISGLPEHHTDRRWIAPALDERNRQLRVLATDTTHDRAWFVIAAPNPIERAQWAAKLGADILVLRTPLDECIRRINADIARPEHTRQRMIDNARAWWASNT